MSTFVDTYFFFKEDRKFMVFLDNDFDMHDLSHYSFKTSIITENRVFYLSISVFHFEKASPKDNLQ